MIAGPRDPPFKADSRVRKSSPEIAAAPWQRRHSASRIAGASLSPARTVGGTETSSNKIARRRTVNILDYEGLWPARSSSPMNRWSGLNGPGNIGLRWAALTMGGAVRLKRVSTSLTASTWSAAATSAMRGESATGFRRIPLTRSASAWRPPAPCSGSSRRGIYRWRTGRPRPANGAAKAACWTFRSMPTCGRCRMRIPSKRRLRGFCRGTLAIS